MSFDIKVCYNAYMNCNKCGLQKDFKNVCRPCKSKADKIWRKNNKEKVANYFKKRWQEPERRLANKLYKERNRFGIDAEDYVKDKSCHDCGITNKHYKSIKGRRLDINHIDDNGRRALRLGDNPNNNFENFMVVCRSCHVSWHNKNVRDYASNK
jgi:thymidine kinase